ncbi:hypothetical protein [Streptacidiphilus sp. P02-A3a]|uniref:hypothetical protein n=1 Tax=Streptacidiphilus sp. P02-A3a TaxID=2704468 RepID=UPI0015FB845D|nr:hypothetical protein [Streptacidiphilus sp. P02-A3a]QMU67797.1 hypothetical protein GXP74_05700 [Streptacidiphilus sp. P02-A3a]
MGSLLVSVLAALVFLFMGGIMIRNGRRVWRGGGAVSARTRLVVYSNQTSAGVERAMPVLGAFAMWAAVLVPAVFLAKHGGSISGAARVVAAVSCIGAVGCAWTGIFIIWFNRPKFLVAPHLRSAPGTMTRKRGTSSPR